MSDSTVQISGLFTFLFHFQGKKERRKGGKERGEEESEGGREGGRKKERKKGKERKKNHWPVLEIILILYQNPIPVFKPSTVSIFFNPPLLSQLSFP